jgi:hypothetical protein
MLTVICPSRGRPGAAAEVMKTFKATAIDLDSRLMFVVDPDDATWAEYPSDLEEPVVLSYRLGEKPARSGMLPALNMAIRNPEILGEEVTTVGFVGDDHRFRTDGWDAAIDDWLEAHPGIAYGDDLFQREALPTQWFVSRAIVNEFGMGLPTLRHLYIDNYWKALGSAAGCLFYLPEIVIEHMHPSAGKGQWDDSYRANNSAAMYASDAEAYGVWLREHAERDVERLRSLVAR